MPCHLTRPLNRSTSNLPPLMMPTRHSSTDTDNNKVSIWEVGSFRNNGWFLVCSLVLRATSKQSWMLPMDGEVLTMLVKYWRSIGIPGLLRTTLPISPVLVSLLSGYQKATDGQVSTQSDSLSDTGPSVPPTVKVHPSSQSLLLMSTPGPESSEPSTGLKSTDLVS